MDDPGKPSDHTADERDTHDLVRERHDWSNTPPSLAVIQALASIEDVDPAGLDLRLHEYIDPEALDRVVANSREDSVAISFVIGRYRVAIDDDELTVGYSGD